MSFEFSLHELRPTEIFSTSITNNLIEMAKEAGIYKCLWCHSECGFNKAKDIVPVLT